MTGLGGSLIGSVGRWLDRGINRLMGAETPAPSDGSLSDDEGVRHVGLHRKTGSAVGGSSTVCPLSTKQHALHSKSAACYASLECGPEELHWDQGL